MAELVDRRADVFVTQAEVKGKPLRNAKIVLSEQTERRNVVIVIRKSARSIRQEGLALKEVLKIVHGGSRGGDGARGRRSKK